MLKKLTPRVDLTNVLHKVFTPTDPKSAKKINNLTVLFVLFGSVLAKAGLKHSDEIGTRSENFWSRVVS